MTPWTCDQWEKCYQDQWKGRCTDACMEHPAKYAPGLITRIIAHALAEGWLRPGETCVDPFAGVALGGLQCGLHGIQWRGVELEARFCELGQANIALWQRKYGPLVQWVTPQLVQGDARQLCAVLGRGTVDAVITSPPYADGCVHNTGQDPTTVRQAGTTATPWGTRAGGESVTDYGTTPGQLGALPPGSVESVITSPPYADQQVGTGGDGRTGWRGYTDHGGGTQATPGQLAALPAGTIETVITSPPYAATDHRPTALGDGEATRAPGDGAGRNKGDYHYPESPGQLGAMPQGTTPPERRTP